ncbi:MAG: DUF3667 domain-containing protein [Flavobacteriales bacterium]
MSEALPCKSCGAAVNGLYCSACGEKVLTPDDHTLKHYLGALLNAFTFADSKLWNTLKAVVLRPGELSAAYMDGRRVKYMRPVAFFFLANFIYFAISTFDTFNTPLDTQLAMPYGEWARTQVDEAMAKSGMDHAAFTVGYNAVSTANAKLLLVVLVFLLSLPMALLYYGKRDYLTAAVTASFELMAFYLWTVTIGLGLFLIAVGRGLLAIGVQAEGLGTDQFTTWPILALHVWGTLGIGRRFFLCTRAGAWWRSAVMFVALAAALMLYRFLLFLLTFWQVS